MSTPYTPGSQPPIGHYLVTNTVTGEKLWLGPDEINWKDVPPVSELTKDQEERIQRLQWSLREHDARPLDEWIHNFRCGVDPEAEIKVYEAILKTYRQELAERKTVTKQERRLLFGTILNASFYPTLDNLLCAFPTAKGLAHLQRVFARYKENVGTSDRSELPASPSEEKQETATVWIASNLPDWSLEECDLPMTDQAKTVSQWMDEPDSNKPSVIRWLSDSVCGDWTISGVKITAQWKYLGDGIAEVCTGRNEVLETIAYVCCGKLPDREKELWIELSGGKVELPQQRPLIVLTHRPAVRDGQHRVGDGRNGGSVALALAYAVGFLNRSEQW